MRCVAFVLLLLACGCYSDGIGIWQTDIVRGGGPPSMDSGGPDMGRTYAVTPPDDCSRCHLLQSDADRRSGRCPNPLTPTKEAP